MLFSFVSVSQTTSFKRLKAFMKRADADEISTSGTSGNERGSNESLPPKPKFEDLNRELCSNETQTVAHDKDRICS